MKKILLLLLSTTILVSSAYAKELDFKQSAIKNEPINVPRHEEDTYKIYTKPLHQTLITFGDENVEYSETGDNISFFTIDDDHSVRIKVSDENLKTDLVVKTDKDIYYFKVMSMDKSYNPMINFLYPQKELLKRQRKIKNNEPLTLTNIDNLNFRYKISKKYSWTPTNIYDDGQKTIFVMPEKVQELPAFLIKDDDGTTSLAIYRVKGNENGMKVFIVDRVFKEGYLVLGKRKVLIKNKNYKY